MNIMSYRKIILLKSFFYFCSDISKRKVVNSQINSPRKGQSLDRDTIIMVFEIYQISQRSFSSSAFICTVFTINNELINQHNAQFNRQIIQTIRKENKSTQCYHNNLCCCKLLLATFYKPQGIFQ